MSRCTTEIQGYLATVQTFWRYTVSVRNVIVKATHMDACSDNLPIMVNTIQGWLAVQRSVSVEECIRSGRYFALGAIQIQYINDSRRIVHWLQEL